LGIVNMPHCAAMSFAFVLGVDRPILLGVLLPCRPRYCLSCDSLANIPRCYHFDCVDMFLVFRTWYSTRLAGCRPCHHPWDESAIRQMRLRDPANIDARSVVLKCCKHRSKSDRHAAVLNGGWPIIWVRRQHARDNMQQRVNTFENVGAILS
jgi:hypothetical protein